MSHTQLPTGREFHRAFTMRIAAVDLPSGWLVFLYALALLRLPPHQASGIWTTAALVLPVTICFFNWRQRCMAAPLMRCLDALSADLESKDVIRVAFANVVDLPRRFFLLALVSHAVPTVAVAGVMVLRFPDFTLYSAGVTAMAGVSVGLLSTIIKCYWTKRWLEPIREDLARRLPDPEERGRLVRRLPLVWKLSAVQVALALVPLVFALFLAYERAPSSGVQLAHRAQGALLERSLARLRESGGESLESVRAEAETWQLPASVVLLDVGSGTILDGHEHQLTPLERAWIRDAGVERGSSRGLRSDHVFRWRILSPAVGPEPSLAVVAVTSLDDLGADGTPVWIFLGLLAGAALPAVVVAWLVAQDVGRAAEALREEAQRIASGDLRSGRPLESEDELGDLGRSFACMLAGLRTTVVRVARAANRVDGTSVEMASISDAVSRDAREQVAGVERVVASTEAIQREASGIAVSAESLHRVTEEAQQSIHEMTAMGEQLGQTAARGTLQADEVASSIEGMGHNVKQVGRMTDLLAVSAEETSSSMAGMATAIREMELTARETGMLSQRTVEAAETGRERMQRTITGMQEIGSASQQVEEVIRSLGERTREIGGIVDVIGAVADETNLLSLNAAIIAAQAGDEGRAFTVVAEQIKQLASSVLSSTREIAERVGSTQAESARAVSAIERGTRAVAAGFHLATEARASLDEITEVARESGRRIHEIVACVEVQAKSATHVVALMERVNDAVREIREASAGQERGTEHVARSSDTLREASLLLREATDRQSQAARSIRDTVTGVRDVAESIHVALQAQSTSCRKAVELIDHVAGRTRSHEESAQRLKSASREGTEEARTLRSGIEQFRL